MTDFVYPSTPLTGQELIAKIQSIKVGDEHSVSRECGYKSVKEFYIAVVEAHQIQHNTKNTKKVSNRRGSVEVLAGRKVTIGPGVLKKVNANVGDLFVISTDGNNITLTRFNE
jgi:hypothetical protein